MLKSDMFIAFDFGLRRIGVAVGQAITGSATPLAVLSAQKGLPNWPEIQLLLESWHPSAFIVGIPYQMDGKEQGISFAARKFAQQLAQHFQLPVHMVDERLTTREAKRQITASGAKGKEVPSLDSYAAKLILEDWLKEHR